MSKGNKTIFYQVLFFCLILAGCQTSTPEAAFESASLPPTRTMSAAATHTPSATATTNPTATPAEPSPVPVTATPTAIPATPTTAPTTASAIPFPVEGFLLYGITTIDDESEIYALQPGGQSRFIAAGQMLGGQAFSPDGTKILVDTNDWSKPPLTPDKVVILDLQTGEVLPLNLLAHPRGGVFWSADGDSLLYVDRYSEEGADKLLLYDLVSEENHILAEMEGILYTAGWSVDGRTIALVAKVNGQYDLFTVDSETLERQQLTDTSDVETMVLWSPTTSQLLVGVTPDNGHVFEMWPWGIENLYLFDANSDTWQLFTDTFLSSESIAWSPDGKQVVYSDAGLLCIKDLETMTEICPLADVAPYNAYFASGWEPPVWSADGNWLAFRAYNQTCFNIVYFLDLETNAVIPGDLGCDLSFGSPIAPIYWLPGHLPAAP